MTKEHLMRFEKGDPRAKINGRKGGSAKKKHNFNRIKNCTPKCPMYPCKLQPVSKSKYKGKCALKTAPKNIQKKMVNILLGGKDGLRDNMEQLLSDIMLEVEKEKNIRYKFQMMDMYVKLVYAIYGKKTIMEGDMNLTHEGSVPFEVMQEAFNRAKENIENGNTKDESNKVKTSKIQSKKKTDTK